MKKPSLTTRLKHANSEIKELQECLEKAQTEAKQNKSYYEMYQKDKGKLEQELNETHAMLDAVNCPLGKETELSEYSSVKNTVNTRLVALFARAAGLGGRAYEMTEKES